MAASARCVIGGWAQRRAEKPQLRVAAILLAAALLGGGCAGGETAPEPRGTVPETRPATTAPAETTTFRVYFVRGEQVGVAGRTVERTQAVGAAALRALLAGPTAAERAAGLHTEIPAGVTLNGLDIADGVATVDLSRSFEDGGGSASMLARVAQVVYTLTQFPAVERVAFRLDGEPAEAIGGEGVVVAPPVDRVDFEAQAPPILVESPAVGEAVSSPVRVRGTASVFEATLFVEIVGPAGDAVAETVVTATEGAPGRGSFEAVLAFDAPPGEGTIVAFTRSAADNSRQHAVEIPVVLARQNP